MTRFTRCESSPPSPVILVRSSPTCHRTAPEEASRKDRQDPQKGSGRAPQGLQKNRGKGARRVFTSLPPHTPPQPPPYPLSIKVNTHCHACRDSGGRAMECESAGSGAPVASQGACSVGQSTKGSPSRWHWPRRFTTARKKWWSTCPNTRWKRGVRPKHVEGSFAAGSNVHASGVEPPFGPMSFSQP